MKSKRNAKRLKQISKQIVRTEEVAPQLARTMYEQSHESEQQLEHMEQVTDKVMAAAQRVEQAAEKVLRQTEDDSEGV
jgi:methyl-accepting chemotaxis protein